MTLISQHLCVDDIQSVCGGFLLWAIIPHGWTGKDGKATFPHRYHLPFKLEEGSASDLKRTIIVIGSVKFVFDESQFICLLTEINMFLAKI